MIRRQDLTAIGRILKTHGTDGQLNMDLYDPDGYDPQPDDCMIFELEGIYVPFFLTQARPRGDMGAIIKLEDVETDAQAAVFCGKEAYVENHGLESGDDKDGEIDMTLDELVGYKIFDTDGTEVGVITDFNDVTENFFFEVRRQDNTDVYVPAVSELITDLDIDNKTITMDLPTGLY